MVFRKFILFQNQWLNHFTKKSSDQNLKCSTFPIAPKDRDNYLYIFEIYFHAICHLVGMTKKHEIVIKLSWIWHLYFWNAAAAAAVVFLLSFAGYLTAWTPAVLLFGNWIDTMGWLHCLLTLSMALYLFYFYYYLLSIYTKWVNALGIYFSKFQFHFSHNAAGVRA